MCGVSKPNCYLEWMSRSSRLHTHPSAVDDAFRTAVDGKRTALAEGDADALVLNGGGGGEERKRRGDESDGQHLVKEDKSGGVYGYMGSVGYQRGSSARDQLRSKHSEGGLLCIVDGG